MGPAESGPEWPESLEAGRPSPRVVSDGTRRTWHPQVAPLQDSPPLVLRHDDSKRAAVPHPEGIFTAVSELFKHAGRAACVNQVEPLLQGILGVNGIIRIGQTRFNPLDHLIELPRIAAQNIGHHLVHLIAALFNHLMPVHESKANHGSRRLQPFGTPAVSSAVITSPKWNVALFAG